MRKLRKKSKIGEMSEISQAGNFSGRRPTVIFGLHVGVFAFAVFWRRWLDRWLCAWANFSNRHHPATPRSPHSSQTFFSILLLVQHQQWYVFLPHDLLDIFLYVLWGLVAFIMGVFSSFLLFLSVLCLEPRHGFFTLIILHRHFLCKYNTFYQYFILFLILCESMQAKRRGLAREESSVVLGDEQVAELKEAFELFDTARAGVLKKETLKNTLKQFGKCHAVYYCCLLLCTFFFLCRKMFFSNTIIHVGLVFVHNNIL